MKRLVRRLYDRLLFEAGPRGWWPGDGRDEIIIGAVLTQNTAWKNVEKALANLKAAGLVSLARLAQMPSDEIAPLIVPAGYFNLKARRLKSVAEFFAPGGRERFDELARMPDDELRAAVLGIWGVGPETADSILLYALGRLTFVVDAYTHRVAKRHGLAHAKADYEHLRGLFTGHSPAEIPHFNEYHALIVWAGHHYCKPEPLCAECPLFRRDCFANDAAWRAIKRPRGPASPRRARASRPGSGPRRARRS